MHATYKFCYGLTAGVTDRFGYIGGPAGGGVVPQETGLAPSAPAHATLANGPMMHRVVLLANQGTTAIPLRSSQCGCFRVR